MNLDKWKVPIDKEFSIIDNGDSVQLVNKDHSRMIYLSLLKAKDQNGGDVDFPNRTDNPPEFVYGAYDWTLQGTKTRGSEKLVILITVTNGDDEEWAREFFSKIGP